MFAFWKKQMGKYAEFYGILQDVGQGLVVLPHLVFKEAHHQSKKLRVGHEILVKPQVEPFFAAPKEPRISGKKGIREKQRQLTASCKHGSESDGPQQSHLRGAHCISPRVCRENSGVW